VNISVFVKAACGLLDVLSSNSFGKIRDKKGKQLEAAEHEGLTDSVRTAQEAHAIPVIKFTHAKQRREIIAGCFQLHKTFSMLAEFIIFRC